MDTKRSRFQRLPREQAIEKLGRLWDAGIASGPAVDGDDAFSRIKSRFEARSAEHDLRMFR